jgi:hypothetical protein
MISDPFYTSPKLTQAALRLLQADAGSLTFGAEGSSKDDLIMALTYILLFGERNTDRRRLRWI